MNLDRWLWLSGPSLAPLREAMLYAIIEADSTDLVRLAAILLTLNSL